MPGKMRCSQMTVDAGRWISSTAVACSVHMKGEAGMKVAGQRIQVSSKSQANIQQIMKVLFSCFGQTEKPVHRTGGSVRTTPQLLSPMVTLLQKKRIQSQRTTCLTGCRPCTRPVLKGLLIDLGEVFRCLEPLLEVCLPISQNGTAVVEGWTQSVLSIASFSLSGASFSPPPLSLSLYFYFSYSSCFRSDLALAAHPAIKYHPIPR